MFVCASVTRASPAVPLLPPVPLLNRPPPEPPGAWLLLSVSDVPVMSAVLPLTPQLAMPPPGPAGDLLEEIDDDWIVTGESPFEESLYRPPPLPAVLLWSILELVSVRRVVTGAGQTDTPPWSAMPPPFPLVVFQETAVLASAACE